MENDLLLPNAVDSLVSGIYAFSGLLFIIATIVLLINFTKTNNAKHLIIMLLIIFFIPIIGPIYYLVAGRKMGKK